jgi:hypothetical protein
VEDVDPAVAAGEPFGHQQAHAAHAHASQT